VKAKDATPLVFVTVGTDHHPFDRLMRWVDGWLEGGASERARCLVQNGSTPPPRTAEHRQYLDYRDLVTTMTEAAVVVCHGGGGSIMNSRWVGKMPIVVPRHHELGEHVDDHQIVFAQRLATEGTAVMVDDEASFRASLERALDDPGWLAVQTPEPQFTPAVERFEQLVDGLLTPRRRVATQLRKP
jgi:UDP-N-acetylglucosamine transferase subunit ALG13